MQQERETVWSRARDSLSASFYMSQLGRLCEEITWLESSMQSARFMAQFIRSMSIHCLIFGWKSLLKARVRPELYNTKIDRVALSSRGHLSGWFCDITTWWGAMFSLLSGFFFGRGDDGMESADKIELLEKKITIMVQTCTADHECKM